MSVLTKAAYSKVVKASAWYDLIVTAPFALPWTAIISINNIQSLHQYLGLRGSIPAFEPFHYFFMNLMGSIVLVWSVLRIKYPGALLGLYDAYGRTLFSLWMIYYLAMGNASSLLYAFLVPELLWGLIQYIGYYQVKGLAEPNDLQWK